jgi:type I restriction enzyme M protein
MSSDTQQIVNRAWNYAHVLRDDGLSYMAYTEQITFLLFLKMAAVQPAGAGAGLSWLAEPAEDGGART